jgi:putative DNA primase/helicase
MDGSTAVPIALREARRWVVWRHLDGRKPPVGPDGRPLANWNEPTAWMSYEEALQVFAASDAVDGVGFVLGGGFGGIDLDEARDEVTNGLVERAANLLAILPTAYAEVSPSGKGIKLFCRASEGFVEVNFKTGAVDLRPSGYFCVTGEAIAPERTEVPEAKLNGILEWLGTSVEAKAREKAEPLAKRVAPGSQEPAMFREACRLRRLGYEPGEIGRMLWTLVEAGRFPNEPGREPWSREDCDAKARAVGKYDPKEDVRETTDPGCAEFFHDTHADGVAFDVESERWLIFDDVRWNPDRVDSIKLRLVESLRARRKLAIDNKDRSAALYKAENRIPQILTAARPYFPTHVTEYDRDPFLLGVTNGVVDLRTGTLRPGTPEDRISMQTAYPFNPEATCPLWEATVAGIFAKDGKPRADTVAYVQRALGYSITGDCREEIFFLCTGRLDNDEKSGRNGKGTIINTVAKILGDYAGDLGFSSLEWQRNSSGAGAATPDLAKLVHKRFVTASETNRGAYFNSARLKALTGRDAITARFLYREEFTFVPELKLWLSVNHPPKVDDDSLGFWKRPHVVEFPNTFVDTANDKTLKDRLMEEAEGILAWLVRGAVAWAESGLVPPPEVARAVEAYQDQQGDLPEFIEARCVEEPSAKSSFDDLRAAYLAWCRDERRRVSGPRDFGKQLRRLYGEPKQGRGESRRYYSGVGVRYAGNGHQEPGAGSQGGGGREPGSDDALPF